MSYRITIDREPCEGRTGDGPTQCSSDCGVCGIPGPNHYASARLLKKQGFDVHGPEVVPTGRLGRNKGQRSALHTSVTIEPEPDLVYEHHWIRQNGTKTHVVLEIDTRRARKAVGRFLPRRSR